MRTSLLDPIRLSILHSSSSCVCVSKSPLRRLPSVLAAVTMLLLLASASLQAQSYSGGQDTRALITQSINESKLVALPGNTHPAATPANDRGAVSDSLPLEHLQLQLQRPPELEQKLEKFLAEQQRQGSPVFHHWLTADQFGQRFGVSPQDIEKVSRWLESHGFQVNAVLKSGMVIEFSGNAGQIREAFHTEIHNLDVKGQAHIANMSDPRIPVALAGVVNGVTSLHDFKPHSTLKKHADFSFECPGCQLYLDSGPIDAVVPADLATIYNLNPAFAAGFTGAGQTIAVIEDTLLENPGDVATFRSAFGLSGYGGTFTQQVPTGAVTCNSPGVNADETEAAIDAEWAGAAAPDATIVLAACSNQTTVFGGLYAILNLINGSSPPQIMSVTANARLKMAQPPTRAL
jgi:subtilase family serine protease